MVYPTTGKLGVDITATKAGTGTSSDEGNEHKLGERVFANDGGEYMYVHTATAITQYDAVGIDENYEASALTKGMADDGWRIGFAQVAASDNDFMWVALEGSNITVRVAGSCAADVALYTTGTAGVLDDTSGSQTRINGVVAVTTNGTSAASTSEVIAISPHPEVAA